MTASGILCHDADSWDVGDQRGRGGMALSSERGRTRRLLRPRCRRSVPIAASSRSRPATGPASIAVKPAQRVSCRIPPFAGIPWLKGILDVPQSGLGQLGEVAEEHGLQTSVVNSGEAFLGVGLFVVVVGVEAVRLQPARGIQNEDLKHGLTESEPEGAMPLRQGADHQAEFLHIARLVSVHILELAHLIPVVSEIVEPPDEVEVQLSSELVVAGHIPFASPQDVDHPHGEQRMAGDTQLPHEVGIVV